VIGREVNRRKPHQRIHRNAQLVPVNIEVDGQKAVDMRQEGCQFYFPAQGE